MGFANQKASSSKVNDNAKKNKSFKGRLETMEKKYHQLGTLCGVRSLLYVESKLKNGNVLVRQLPENPVEFQELYKDYINYDPKTAGKRKRVSDSEDMNHKKMRRFGDSADGSTKLGYLSIDEIEKMERKFDPIFADISERLNQMIEKKKSSESPSEGCSDKDVILMNDYQSSSSSMEEFLNYSSHVPVLENEFDNGINQELWLNLPVLTNSTTTDEDKSVDPSAEGCSDVGDVITNVFFLGSYHFMFSIIFIIGSRLLNHAAFGSLILPYY